MSNNKTYINFKDINKIPRTAIAHTPTPFEHLPRLSQELACHLYIKRDDCTGLAGGGNKVRKLEYLLADAISKEADVLVTVGGMQSNHARQTAAVAAKFGFDCELVLEDVKGTPKSDYYNNGNVLLDQLLGAKIHSLSDDQDGNDYANTLIKKLKNQGRKPYLIPIGGSNVIGSMGYVQCAYEIVEQITTSQISIDQIVLATGSAGTQAGLIAGLIAAQADIPVIGICVSRSSQEQNQLLEGLVKEILVKLDLNPSLSAGKVKTNGDYYGHGYGMTTPEMMAAIRKTAELEGLLLDPVYTGKAMAGLMDLCSKGIIKPNSNLLFLHTGGSPGLFGYCEAFSE